MSNFLAFLKKYFKIIFLIYLSNIILMLYFNYILYIHDFNWFLSRSFKSIIYSLVFEVVLIHLFYLFLKQKTKYFLYFYLVFAVLDFIFEGFLLLNYHTLINPLLIQVLLDTNLRESYEFLITFIGFKDLLSILGIVIAVFLVLKFLKNPKQAYPKIRKIFIIFYFIVIIILSVDFINKFFIKNDSFGALERLNENALLRILNKTYEFFGNDSLYGKYKSYIKNYENITQGYKGKVLLKEKIPYVVLIIGESTGRNHMSLYGYELDTNPRLKKLEKEGNLIKFDDVISPFAHTAASLLRVLTFASNEDKVWEDKLDLVDLFNLAGYKSIFISNQEKASLPSSITSAIASRANKSIFANSITNDDKTIVSKYDEVLLPFAKENLNNYHFFIFHLLGTHANYKYRYPKDFEKFSAKDINTSSLNTKQKQLVAEYDNAVLYNDFVVNEVFNLFKDKDSVIIYLSDHSESLYEDKGFLGHFKPSRFTAEIPFLIIVSDTFKQNHKELYEKIIKAKSKAFMSDDLIHALCTLGGGIMIKDYNATRDILNPKFNEKRKRMLNQGVDYDKELKNEKAFAR